VKRLAEQLVDEALVLACQQGRADAMDQLVRRWQGRLCAHARSLIGREDAAREVLQNAWLGIIRGIRKLNDPERFRAWAYRIVTHKAADWIKHHQRSRRFAEELVAEPPAPETDTPRAADIREALNQLPTGCRAILTLRYLESFSVSEIAEALGIPPGTVKSRLYHARENLKQIWMRSES